MTSTSTSDFEFKKPTDAKTGTKSNPTSKVVKTPVAPEPVVEAIAADEGDSKVSPPKFDEQELMSIFDDLMFHGEYSEEFMIRGKLPVRFRSRSAEEIQKISMEVDSNSGSATLLATLSEQRSLLNLEFALMSYGSKDLASLKREERAKFVGKLPAPMVGTLLMLLSKFDQKVFEACKEGEANF